MDVGGYQIVDFRHGTIVGSNVLELSFESSDNDLEKIIERLNEVALINVPIMINNINVKVTGEQPITLTNLSIYGYRFKDKFGKHNYEFVTSYGVFNIVVSGNRLKVTLK